MLIHMQSLIQGQPAMVHAGSKVQMCHAKTCRQKQQSMGQER